MIVNRNVGENGGETASIFVTGLSETDTVTATKDGKTYNGKWVSEECEIYVSVPTMTSNTTPEGEVICSTPEYNPSYGTFEGYKAFDKNVSDTGNSPCFSGLVSELPNVYVGYKFINPTKVTSFSITQRNLALMQNFKTIVLEYSDNGYDWTAITDLLSCEQSSSSTPLKVDFYVDNAEEYHLYWRVRILEKYTTEGIVVSVLELDFFGTQIVTKQGWIFDKLPQYGTYTITATDGTNTATQDVLVDMAIQFDVEITLSGKLYLYNLGDECEDVTGGWSQKTGWKFGNFNSSTTFSNSSYQLSKQDNYLTLPSYYIYSSNATTNNQVDLTAYSKMHVLLENRENDSNTTIIGWYVINNSIGSVSEALKLEAGTTINNVVGIDSELEIDISNITGVQYIAIIAYSDRSFYIKKVWLE